MKSMDRLFLNGISLVALAALATACGKSTTSDGSSSESASEIATATAVGSSNGGQNVGLNSLDPRVQQTFFAQLKNFLSPISSAMAGSGCPYYIVGNTACSDNAVTFSYNDCSFGNALAIWSGSQTLQFGNGATCDTTPLPLTGSGTLTRTFGAGSVRVSALGKAVTIDSTNPSGYYQSVSGGSLITGVSGGHSIAIDGIHLVASGWDHSLSTTQNLAVSIDGSGNRTFTSGVVQLQHNLAKYVALASFNNVYVPAGSCFPSSGSVTSTFSGSRSGSETLTFTGGGNATLSSSGSNIAVTLSHCF